MTLLDSIDSRAKLRAPVSPIALTERASFELVFKIQETCNINCTYCYMYNVGNELYKDLPPRSPIETCRSVAEMLAAEAAGRDPRKVRLILHGGEPMLMKPADFEARLRAIDEVLNARLTSERRARIDFTLQTNATLVSPAWIDLIARWGIKVGVSIDGPAHVHDDRRLDKKGRGTHAAVVRGIRQLQDAHAAGRISEIGALCVINPHADGGEVYRFLAHEMGLRSFDFLLPFMNWDDFDPDQVDRVRRFLLSAFDAWRDDIAERRKVEVRIFNKILASLSRPLGRFQDGMDLTHQVVVVESDGTILPEESLRIAYDGRFADLAVGRARSNQVLNDPRFYTTIAGSWTRAAECSGCALIDSCASGQAAGRVGMRYASGSLFERKSVYCEAFVDLYVAGAAFLAGRGRRLALLETKPDVVAEHELEAI
jgi:uncharacterized protein